MRILVVGSGGVGSAFAPIAARRDFYEHIVFADIDEAKPRHIVDRYGAHGKSQRREDRRDRRDASSRRRARARVRHHPERRRPALRDADLPGRARGRCELHGHGDVALRTAPRAPARGGRQEARRRSVRDGRPLGGPRCAGPGRHRHRARAPPTCSRGTPPTTCSARSTRSGVRDGANLEIEGYDFAPTFSIWTTIEECLNPPVIWEKDRGWFTTAPFSEPETFDVPRGHRRRRVRERRARRGAARAPLGRLPAGDVQVRPRRRVHRGARRPCTSSASTASRR